MQKCRNPSFFQIKTTALHYMLWLGWIVPGSSISHKCIWISSTKGGDIHLDCSLNGVSSVTLITCVVEWVQPSSLGSSEKMSGETWQPLPTLVAMISSPLRSKSLNNFSWHCFMVNLGIWQPCLSSDASVELICTGSSGIQVSMTALAAWVFFLRVWGYAVLFLTTTTVMFLLLPCNCI